jgi:pSer/pThr/pTyr-binding forkhead associated (FHA) protein
MAKLICVHGNNLQDEFELKEGTNRIGRAPTSDIVIFDKRCSRNHCEIYRRGKYYSIEDLSSRHGTTVNGKPLTKRHELRIGDRIHMGRTILMIAEEGTSDLDRLTSELTHEIHDHEMSELFDDTEVAFMKSRVHGGRRKSKMKSFFGNMFKKK